MFPYLYRCFNVVVLYVGHEKQSNKITNTTKIYTRDDEYLPKITKTTRSWRQQLQQHRPESICNFRSSSNLYGMVCYILANIIQNLNGKSKQKAEIISEFISRPIMCIIREGQEGEEVVKSKNACIWNFNRI